MKMDRSLFLALTGAIAAVACGSTQPPPAQTLANPANATSASASSMSAAPSPSTASTSSKASASSTSSAPVMTSTPAASSAPTLVASAPPPPPPPRQKPVIDPSKQKPLGIDSGCAVSSASYDDTRKSCDDNIGPGGDCSGSFNGYPSNEVCPGPVQFRKRCNAYSANFKPKVAEAADACLATGKMRNCNSCIPYSCGHKALMDACPDPSSDDACDTIEQSCSGMSRVQCHSYLSGMNDKGRATMVECLTKNCGLGFNKCLMLNVQ